MKREDCSKNIPCSKEYHKRINQLSLNWGIPIYSVVDFLLFMILAKAEKMKAAPSPKRLTRRSLRRNE